MPYPSADEHGMDERYWDRVAPNYLAEVHDTLAMDKDGTIKRWLARFASRTESAVDFGCGVGRYLRALSKQFKCVYALDHSRRCLDEAMAAHWDVKNVVYRKANLARSLQDWKRASFGVCMNVLISPDHNLRTAMVRTMHRALSPGAHLMVVVPALESALFTDVRLVEWNMREGMSHRRALREGMAGEPGVIGPVAAGIIDCGGEPTKHYLCEEAMLMLQHGGFEIEAIEKAHYSWSEEFDAPPRWMREPYPWHWLLVCKR